MARSWKAEVLADTTGVWISNTLRFATPEEARHYVWELSLKWTAVKDTRVVSSEDSVNYAINDGKLERVDG